MLQNLKVDVIYHASPSDFEMEFNLNCTCHMRLLSANTTDKKGFINSLIRAVSRSRVIIACGPLFGAEGLIKLVGTAIGNGTCVCDNRTYGINTEDQIHIINGSTPLVTPDGYFGGCIIESGPQTIILLTENKTFRKVIMQNLIHPYVEEICYIPAKESAFVSPDSDENAEFETAVSETEEYIVTPDEEYQETDPESAYDIANQDEHNVEFVMDDDNDQSEIDEPIVPEDFNLMYTEVETPQEIQSRYEDSYSTAEGDTLFIAEPERDKLQERAKKQAIAKNTDVAIVILVLLILLAVLALVYLLILRPLSMGVPTANYIKEIFGLVSQTTSV